MTIYSALTHDEIRTATDALGFAIGGTSDNGKARRLANVCDALHSITNDTAAIVLDDAPDTDTAAVKHASELRDMLAALLDAIDRDKVRGLGALTDPARALLATIKGA